MALILRAIRFEEACDPPCFKTLFLGKSEFFDRHLDDCKARFGGERIEGLVCRLILTAFRIIFDEACADFAVVISGCAKGRERFVDRLAEAVLDRKSTRLNSSH